MASDVCVHVSEIFPEMTFSLGPHPFLSFCTVPQSESVPVGENMRLCSCGHYCTIICWWEVIRRAPPRDFKKVMYFDLLFSAAFLTET